MHGLVRLERWHNAGVENVDSIMLEHLRAIRAEQAVAREDRRELKIRMTDVEIGLAAVLKHIAHLAESVAVQHSRYDRIVDRLDRIEKRLDLVGTP